MTIIQQLFHATTANDESEKLIRGVRTILAVAAGNYTPEEFTKWLNYDKVSSGLQGSNGEGKFIDHFCMPHATLQTSGGPLSYGYDPRVSVSMDILEEGKTPEKWLLDYNNHCQPSPVLMNNIKGGERRTRRGSIPEMVIVYQGRAIMIPFSHSFQSDKEVILTMLKGYDEFLKIAKIFAVPGGRVNVDYSISQLTNGLIQWNDQDNRYVYCDIAGSIYSDRFPMYVGYNNDWSQHKGNHEVYKAVVGNTIMNNILDFEQDALRQIIKHIEGQA